MAHALLGTDGKGLVMKSISKHIRARNVGLIAILGAVVWGISSFGEETMQSESIVSKPLQKIPQLSSSEKERIYCIRVIDRKDAWRCPIEGEKLEWPQQDRMIGDLYKNKSAELQPVIKWVRNFVRWPAETKVEAFVERGEENIYCIFEPPLNNIRLRFWRDPHNITRRYPQRIDLQKDISVDDATLDSLVIELASLKMSNKAHMKDIPKVMKLFTKLPLRNRVVALPWTVREFSVRHDCRLVHIKFEVAGPRNPLLMQLFVGPKGLMVMIEGKKLESPSILFETKGITSDYDPMKEPMNYPK